MELWSGFVLLVNTLGDVTVWCVFMDKILAYYLCTLLFVLLVNTLGDVTVRCVFMDNIIAYYLCTLFHLLALDSKAKICVYFIGLAYQGQGYCV
jgi:hypothetical protein